MTDALKRLSDEGVAIWLDDLSRKRITSGNLAELIDQSHVVGVTTNPSIFQKAISSGDGYEQQLTDLASRKVTVEEAIRMITTADVRDAADILRPVFDRTDGQDGRVSIEVDPRLAHHTVPTVAEAKQLAWLVDRPNTLIKIPATKAGLPADHRGHREGHQRQRDADLLAGALPRGRGRLHHRPGAGEGRGPGPVEDPLGRLLLRVPRGHRDRQAAGRPRHRRGEGRQGQGRPRQRPSGVRGVRGALLLRPLGRPRQGAGQQAASAVGLHRRQGPGAQGHPVRRRPRRPEHGQHHAGGDPGGRGRPRSDLGQHGRRMATTGRVPPSTPSRSSASATTRSWRCWKKRASTSSRPHGTTCSSRPRRSSRASLLRRADHFVWCSRSKSAS